MRTLNRLQTRLHGLFPAALVVLLVAGCLQPTEALMSEEELLGTAALPGAEPEASGDAAGDDASDLDSTAPADVADVAAEDAAEPSDAPGEVAEPDAEVSEPEPATPTAKLLVGHWMQRNIGDCIQEERWFTLEVPNKLTHTLKDDNTCSREAEGVFITSGTFSAPDPNELVADYELHDGTEVSWTRTFALVDYLATDIQETPEGYIQSKRAQNHMAYVRTGEALEYLRTDDETTRWAAGGIYGIENLVKVRMNEELTTGDEPAGCAMTVDVAIQVTIDEEAPPGVALETFILPCTMGPVADHPLGWYRVTANGFEGSEVDGSWDGFFASQGLFQKYPSHVVDVLLDAFRPVLYYRPADTSRFFHDVAEAWVFEMFSAPPAGLEESE